MNCPRCGNTVYDGNPVCNYCGMALQNNYNQYNMNGQYNPYNNQYNMNNQYNPYGQYNGYNQYNPYYTKHKYMPNIAGMILSAMFGVSVFFPYVKAQTFYGTESASISQGSDWIILVPLAVIAFIIFIVDMTNIGSCIANIIFGVIAIALTIIEKNYTDDLISANMRLNVSYGIGYYMMLVGAVGILVASIAGLILRVQRNKRMRY